MDKRRQHWRCDIYLILPSSISVVYNVAEGMLTRLALASILGPFGVHLLKFILDTHPDVDLGDHAVGRPRYERFYSVRSTLIMQEKICLWRRSREPSRGCLWRKLRRRKSIKHISKNNLKSSKIPDHTHRAHVLREHKRTCTHESKRKSYQSSDEIAIVG